MNQQQFVNNFNTTLASAAAAGATSITVATGKGALLPTLSSGDYLVLTLTQPGGLASETSWENVTVSVSASGDVVTCSALQNAWPAGSVVRLGLPSTFLNNVARVLNRRAVSALGSITGGTATIDLSGPDTITLTVGAAMTIALTNTPASGESIEKTVYVTNGGAFAITYPSNSRWPGPGVVQSAPALVASGTEILKFRAINIGGTVYVDWFYIGRVA